MTNLISILATFIIHAISSLGYFGVALMMAIESACIPLPSEIIMPFAGYLISQGQFTLLGAALAGAIGSVFGSLLAYIIGYYGGRPFIERYGKYLLLSHHDLDLADKFFNNYGSMAIFFSRMLPVIRTFISLPAGIAEMNIYKFIIYTFAGSLPWCLGLAYLGQKMGDHWDKLGKYFHQLDAVIILGIIIILILFFKKHLSKK